MNVINISTQLTKKEKRTKKERNYYDYSLINSGNYNCRCREIIIVLEQD